MVDPRVTIVARASPRRRVAAVLDGLGIALLAMASAIIASGGLVFYILRLRISLGSSHRALLALFIVIVIRVIVAGRIGPFGFGTERWQHLLDSVQHEPLVVPPRPGARRRSIGAALGIGAALVALLHGQVLHLDWVSELGDPLFSIWRVGWVAHQIVRDPAHLFDANIFYPERLTFTLSDPVIVPALTMAPLLALGVHPVVAYNLLLLSGFWLSGVAMYLLVERLTGSPRGAFVAGLTFACCGYRFEHYMHLELQMMQWTVLALLALHLFLSTGRTVYAIWFGLAAVAQLYSSMYYAAFLVPYAALITMGLVRVYRCPLRPLMRAAALSAALVIVLATPLARAFIAAEPMKGPRPLYEVNVYSAFPSDYLRANRYSALWRNRLGAPLPERSLFPGAAPLALAAVGVAPPFGMVRLAYVAGLLAAADGSLGVRGLTYPFYYEFLRPFRGMRVAARFAALVALSLSILAGFGAARAIAWRGSRVYQHTTFAILIAVTLADAWPRLELQPVWRTPPPIYEPLASVPQAVLAEFPMGDSTAFNTPYLYFSLWHWHPMVNGYSGFTPQSYTDVRHAVESFPAPDALAALRERGVTHVTITCGLRYRGCDDLLNRARRSPLLRPVEETTWEGEPAALYELERR
jgi:hypothetical protein